MKYKEKPITADAYKNSVEFQEELALLKAQELISELMAKKGVNQAELAKRLDQSRAHVSELLSGSRNLTLRTMGRIFFYLGEEVEFNCKDKTESKYIIGSQVSARVDRNLPRPSFGHKVPVQRKKYYLTGDRLDLETVVRETQMQFGL